MERKNFTYGEIEIRNIMNWKIPDFQRNVDQQHLSSIYDKIRDKYLQTHEILLPTPLIVATIDGIEFSLLDGQHRYISIKKLYQIYPTIGQIKIRVDGWKVDNSDQMFEIYSIINQSKPVQLYLNIDLSSNARTIEKWFRDSKFRDHLKDSKKPQIPNINTKEMMKRLEFSGLLKINPDQLIKEIIIFNDMISKVNLSNYGLEMNHRINGLIIDSNFYLGLYRRYEWIGMLFKDYKKIDLSSSEIRKIKIPKSRQIECWNKRFKGLTDGKCYTCDRDLNCQTSGGYECGHIISEYEGGSIDLDNLEVVCKTCNLNMSTMNMEAYKALFNS